LVKQVSFYGHSLIKCQFCSATEVTARVIPVKNTFQAHNQILKSICLIMSFEIYSSFTASISCGMTLKASPTMP